MNYFYEGQNVGKIALQQFTIEEKTKKEFLIGLIMGAIAAQEALEERKIKDGVLALSQEDVYADPKTYEFAFSYTISHNKENPVHSLKKLIIEIIPGESTKITDLSFVQELIAYVLTSKLTLSDIKQFCETHLRPKLTGVKGGDPNISNRYDEEEEIIIESEQMPDLFDLPDEFFTDTDDDGKADKSPNGNFRPMASCPASPPPPPPVMASRAAPAMPQTMAASPKKPKKSIKDKISEAFKAKRDKKSKQKIIADDVQFRGAAPAVLEKGAYSQVKILMYREDDFERANREVMRFADKVIEHSTGVFNINRGEKLRIVLQSPDIVIEDDIEELMWNGIYSECMFDIFIPDDYEKKQIFLKGRIYRDQAVLTDIKLILSVEAEKDQDIDVTKCELCSAFVSYASQDRKKVVARIQGIQAARKDMDIFLDVEKLRCGELWEPRLFYEIDNRNIFYLFWSSNAEKSEWVKKELDHVLEVKGIDAVEPIPLEPPDVCFPPEALKAKHFNDWTLRYLQE